MVTRISTEEMHRVSPLFEGWQETLIWSCLQGVMGSVYGKEILGQETGRDTGTTFSSAMAVLGDFAFPAGQPDVELISYRPEGKAWDFMILAPETEAWEAAIREYFGERARKVVRYALKKEPDVFDRKRLQRAAEGLPSAYELKALDETLFARCRETGWCRDWVSQYASWEEYEKRGLGVVALRDGEPVSGASSYSSFEGGIEIEIDTREDSRRKGLAYGCAAKLILKCLERGWYPSWDAQNPASLALAEKLGYHLDHAYTAYEVRD